MTSDEPHRWRGRRQGVVYALALHPVPVFAISGGFIATSRLGLVPRGAAEEGSLISLLHLLHRLPQLPVLLFRADQRRRVALPQGRMRGISCLREGGKKKNGVKGVRLNKHEPNSGKN